MSIQYQQPSSLFKNFRGIPTSQHFAIIRFVEQNASDIEYLSIEERMVIQSYYVDALFEEGGMEQQFIAYARQLLEDSIALNIQFIDGQDIYLRTLYQKANAHLRLGDAAQATKIATQLLRLAPKQVAYQTLVRDCLLVVRPSWVRASWAMGLGLIILGIFTSLTNMFFIELVYNNYTIQFAQAALLMFVTGSLALALGLASHYYFVSRRVRTIQLQAQRK